MPLQLKIVMFCSSILFNKAALIKLVCKLSVDYDSQPERQKPCMKFSVPLPPPSPSRSILCKKKNAFWKLYVLGGEEEAVPVQTAWQKVNYANFPEM